MTGSRVSLQNVPERLAIAALSGLLAWWFARTAVQLWWAAVPCVALALAVISGRLWVTWLTWGLATTGLAASLALTLRSPRAEVVFASVALAIVFAGLTAGSCALVMSREFPHHTTSLVVWLAIASALTGESETWIVPAALAVLTGIAVVASRQRSAHQAGFRPLVPILAGVILVALIAGVSPVGHSPARGPLAALVEHALAPGIPVPVPPQQENPATATREAPGTIVHYAAPLFQLWIDTLTRVLLPWAVPMILGLMTLLAGLIMLLLITRSTLSHVLHMLARPLLILGAVVTAALLVSGLQLPRGPALMKLYEQLATISGLAKAQQPAAVGQALHEVTRSVPSWLQLLGAIASSIATLAIMASVALILSKAIFDTRFGFLLNIPDPRERKRVAASIRRVASLDEASLAADPREAVIALFYMGVAALHDINIILARGETPEELVLRTREQSEIVSRYLDLLATSFYVARYSNEEIDLPRAIASRNAYKGLVAAIKTESEKKHANRAQPITL